MLPQPSVPGLQLGPGATTGPQTRAQRVNIILIISDTVRSDCCGCYGSPRVRTPHIDALARDGTICGRWPLYSTISHPPLLVRLPGEAGGERLTPFCQPPDLMPTILELAGAPVPDRVQGESVLPLIRGDRDCLRDFAVSSLTYLQDAEARAPTCFRTREHLYVYGGDEWDHELFDLCANPDETENVIDTQEDVARGLHAQLHSFLARVGCPAASLEARREFRPAKRADIPYRKLI